MHHDPTFAAACLQERAERSSSPDMIKLVSDVIGSPDRNRDRKAEDPYEDADFRHDEVARLTQARILALAGVPCVYFIRSEQFGATKIGMSRNLPKRFRDIDTGTVDTLRLVGALVNCRMRRVEAELHDVFAGKRVKFEWFDLSDRDMLGVSTVYADIWQEFNWGRADLLPL